MRQTALDRKWDELMSRCAKEAELAGNNRHLKLVRFLGDQIDKLATELGFQPNQIRRREFRPAKDGDHIVRMLTG
jgi:hypothetical protein